MLIPHKGHTDTIQVYSVTVMTHVKALQAGHSSQGDIWAYYTGTCYVIGLKIDMTSIGLSVNFGERVFSSWSI